MSQNNYFQKLRQLFKGNPYRDRFLSELEDHAEDVAEVIDPKSKFNDAFLEKLFGTPEEVKKTFISINNPFMKYLYLGIFALLFLLFIAPWYQTGHGRENVTEQSTRPFSTKLDENGNRIKACDCDGSCIIQDTHWAPFGVLINDCSYDSYYKIFWGTEFHINSDHSSN